MNKEVGAGGRFDISLDSGLEPPSPPSGSASGSKSFLSFKLFSARLLINCLLIKHVYVERKKI